MEKKIKYFVCLLLLVLSSCSRKHKLMNHEQFEKIPTYSEFSHVTKKFGPPYDYVLLKDGIKEYRYIQRNQIAPGVTEYVNFIFATSYEGFIIGKDTETITGTAELYRY